MSHRSVKKKRKKEYELKIIVGQQSRREWPSLEDKVDEQTMIFLVVHQEDHFIEHAATVQCKWTTWTNRHNSAHVRRTSAKDRHGWNHAGR